MNVGFSKMVQVYLKRKVNCTAQQVVKGYR